MVFWGAQAGSEGVLGKRIISGIDRARLWVDLESAMVELESTHVRMGSGFISILGFFVRLFDDILGFGGSEGGG